MKENPKGRASKRSNSGFVVRSDARAIGLLLSGGGFLALDNRDSDTAIVVDGSPSTSFLYSSALSGFSAGVGEFRGTNLAYVDQLTSSDYRNTAFDRLGDSEPLSLSNFGLNDSAATATNAGEIIASTTNGASDDGPISSDIEVGKPSPGEVPPPKDGQTDSDETAAEETETCNDGKADEVCAASDEATEEDGKGETGIGAVGAAGGGIPLTSMGGFSSGGGSVSVSLSGAVVDGYVEGATVFADLDGDGAWSTGEPTAITDSSGAYTLSSVYDLSQYSIIAIGGTDVTTGSNIDFMIAPAGVAYVTPLAAIAYYAEQAGLETSSVLEGLGFSYADLLYDPAADETYNENFLVAGASILTAVSSSASLLAEASGDDVTGVSASIFAQLAIQNTDDIKLLTDRSDADSDPSTFLNSILTSTVAARGMTIDADVLTSAAESIGSVVKELRTAESLSDVYVAASIGQSLLKTDLKTVGQAIKNGDSDVTTLMAGIQGNYQDSFATLKTAQESALKGRNSGIEGLTVKKDVLAIELSSTGEVASWTLPSGTQVTPSFIKDRAVFESSNELIHVLLENDSIASNLNASIILTDDGLLTPLDGSEGIVITPTNSGLGFEVHFDESFFEFDIESVDFSASVDPIGDLLVLLNAATAKFGDYYFEYQVGVEGASSLATGLVTIQVVPEVTIDLVPTFTTTEDSPFLLSDLITSRTFGPGDQMVISGLPMGSILALEMVDDPILGSETLTYTASNTAPVVTPISWMLPWRFDDITVTLPEDYAGSFGVDMTIVAQYESATSRDSDEVVVTVAPVADGISAGYSAALGKLAQQSIGTGRYFEEGSTSQLFSEATALVALARSAVTDDSEASVVVVGVDPGFLVSNETAIDGSIYGLDMEYKWYLFNDLDSNLEKTLTRLQLTVEDDFLSDSNVGTNANIQIMFGAVESADLSNIALGAVKTIAAGTVTKPLIPVAFADSTVSLDDDESDILGLASTSEDFTGSFSISISTIVPQAQQSADLPDDQLLTIQVSFPSDYRLIPVAGKTNWSLVEEGVLDALANATQDSGTQTIYELRDIAISDLYDASIAPLVLRPGTDYVSTTSGDTVRFAAYTYTSDQPNITLSLENSAGAIPTINLLVPPDLDVGLVGAQANSIELEETQGSSEDGWVALNQFLAIDTGSLSSLGTNKLHLDFLDNASLGITPIEMRVSGETLTAVVDTENTYNFTINLADSTTVDEIEIRGAPYLHVDQGGLEASFYLSVTIEGYDPIVGEASVINTIIEAQASDVVIEPEALTVQDYQSSENQAFALSNLIATDATLTDDDGSEVLWYQMYLPTSVYLETNGVMKGGRLVEVGGTFMRFFEIAASTVENHSVVPSDSHAETGIAYYITPLTIDVNGDRKTGEREAGTFDILGVSEAPILTVVTGVSGLLDGANTSELSVPVSVRRADIDETLTVRISLSSEHSAGIEGVTLTVGSTELALLEGGFVELSSSDENELALIQSLPTLSIRADKDYRDTNAITLSVEASSQDGSSDPITVTQSASIEIYQPVSSGDGAGEVLISILKDSESNAIVSEDGNYSIVFDVTYPELPGVLDIADVTFLMTGVSTNTYFWNGSAPVGAALGGGVWLFTGQEIGSAGGSIEVVGSDIFTPTVKAIFTDSIGGTSGTSEASALANLDPIYDPGNPLDPVVISFDENANVLILKDYSQNPVAFDFVVNSLEGLESASYWFTGDYGDSGGPSGTAFVVRGNSGSPLETVSSYGDLYTSIDELISDVDLDRDGSISTVELATAGTTLWFDSENGVLGVSEEGELVLASEVLVGIEGSTYSILDQDYQSWSGDNSFSSDVGVIDRLSFGYGEGRVAHAFGISLPYHSDHLPLADLIVPSQVDEDASIPVTITFTPMSYTGSGSPTIVNLLKIYGVPEGGVLSNAIRVENSEGATDYWLTTVEESTEISTISLDLSFNSKHVVEEFDLSVIPLVSVTDVSDPFNPSIETVMGLMSSEQHVSITARAETSLTLSREGESSLELSEGVAGSPSQINFSDLGITVSSPDEKESLSIALVVTDSTGATVSDLFTVSTSQPYLVLKDQATTSGSIEVDGVIIPTISASDIDTLSLRMPDLVTGTFHLTMYPVSEHDGDHSIDLDSAMVIDININAVAQGAENLSVAMQDGQGEVASIFTEGETASLFLSADRIDETETLLFQVTVTEVGSETFTQVNSIGDAIPIEISGNQATYEFLYESESTISPLNVSVDKNFSGELSFSTTVVTIDPISGDVSDVATSATVTSSLVFQGDPGNGGESFITSIRQDGSNVASLEAVEGESLSFTVRALSLDLDEVLTLETSNENIVIEDSSRYVNTSGVFAYDFSVRYDNIPELESIDSLSLKIVESGAEKSFNLDPISLRVDPTTQGVTFSGAPLISLDAEGAITTLVEGQPAYLHTRVIANDTNEILSYKVKISGSVDLENGLLSIGSLSASDGIWSLLPDGSGYYEFQFSGIDESFSDPLQLLFDQYFNGDIEVEVGVSAFEPRASDPDSSSSRSDYLTYSGALYGTGESLSYATISGDPGNYDSAGNSNVVFDIATELTVEQLTNLDSILVGGNLLAINLIESITGFSNLSSYLDEDPNYYNLGAESGSINIDMDPRYNGSISLAVRTEDGEIIEISSVQVESPLSYHVSILANDREVTHIDAKEEADVSFKVRVSSYDASESFSLTSKQEALIVQAEPTVISSNGTHQVLEFDVQYISIPEGLTGLDELTLSIKDGDVTTDVSLAAFPVRIDPVSQGVNVSGPPVLTSDQDGAITTLFEGDGTVYLHPNLNPIDSGEILNLTIVISALDTPDLETGLKSVSYMSSEDAQWDAVNRTFTFSFLHNDPNRFDELGNDLLIQPIPMVLDPYFNGSLSVSVEGYAFEPLSLVGDTSPPASSSQVVEMVIQTLPGNDAGQVNEVTFNITELLSSALLEDVTEDDIDRLLIGGSTYEVGSLISATPEFVDSSDGQYKEFIFDEDGDGTRDFDELNVTYEPQFVGDVKLKIQTKNGNIIDVDTITVASKLSFDYEFRQDESSVNTLTYSTKNGLNYIFRINLRDINEEVSLYQAGQLLESKNTDLTPIGSVDYSFSYTDMAAVRDMSAIRDISVVISESGVQRTYQVPEIEVLQAVDNYRFEVPKNGFENFLLSEALPLDGIFSSKSGLIQEYILSTSDPNLLGAGIILKQKNETPLEVTDHTTFRAYHLTAAQANFATITLAAAANLFSNTAQAQLIWNATTVEGNEIQPGGVQIDLIESSQYIDLVVNDGKTIFAVEGDSIDVNFSWSTGNTDFQTIVVSGVEAPLVPGSHVLIHDVGLFGIEVADDPLTTNDESALASYQPGSGTAFWNDKALLTSSDIFILPDVNSWGFGENTSYVPLADIFGDGYFGDMMAGEEFVFIDDAFGAIESNSDGTAIDKISASATIVGFGVTGGTASVIQYIDRDGDAFIPDHLTRIHGTDSDDLIVSNSKDGSILYGAGGINELIGNAGIDLLISGAGTDLLQGNKGSDIYQIAVDAKDSQSGSRDMNLMLTSVIGDESLLQKIASIHDGMKESESFSALSAYNSDASVTNFSFTAFVKDYSHTESESDRLIFSNGNDNEIELTHESFSHTWGNGDSDNFVYIMAREFSNTASLSADDSYTSVLVQLADTTAINGEFNDDLDLQAFGIFTA